MLCLCPLSGCMVGPPESGPSSRLVDGDWDDLDAAVDVGLEAAEVAVLRREVGQTHARWEIVSIRDQRGELVIRRTDAPGKLMVEATIDQPSDTERAGRLVSAVARRLGQLFGRDVAPAR